GVCEDRAVGCRPARSPADTSVFRPLELPSPTPQRDASGRPGPAYWQQRVDYSIVASLDTVAQTIAGDEVIQYHNNSPDTLREVWLQLDQNLYRPDSRGAQRFADVGRAKPAGFVGGYAISGVTQAPRAGMAAHTLTAEVRGTMMRVVLATRILPRDSTTLR